MLALSMRFKPLAISEEIGTIECQLVDVSMKESVLNGYYLLTPVNQCVKEFSAEYPNREFETLTRQVSETTLAQAARGESLKNVSILMDWMSVRVQEAGVTGEYLRYANEIRTSLQRYNTVKFKQSLSLMPSEFVLKMRDPKTLVVRKGAKYKHILQLAVERMQNPDIWTDDFVRKLIYRIGTGDDSDQIMPTLQEIRAVLKELNPEIKLASWDVFRAMKLSKVFAPADFEDMEDILISMMMSDSLYDWDAISKVVLTPNGFLRNDYQNPIQGKTMLSDWVVYTTKDSTIPWQANVSSAGVELQPQAGRTMPAIRKQMDSEHIDQAHTIPIKMSWDEFEKHVFSAYPGTIRTGVQILSNEDLPKLIKHSGCDSLSKITLDSIRNICFNHGIDHKGTKEEVWPRLVQWIVDQYPEFDRRMCEALEGITLIRVPKLEHKHFLNNEESVKWEEAREVFMPHNTEPILMDFMFSMFFLYHTYADSIVRPNYVSKMFTLEGLVESIQENGHKTTSHGPFYYLTSNTKLPVSLPNDTLAPHESVKFGGNDEINVEGGDDLIDELLGDMV